MIYPKSLFDPRERSAVKVRYKADYRKALNGELQPHLLKRETSVIRPAEDNIRDLATSNLIVVFSKF